MSRHEPAVLTEHFRLTEIVKRGRGLERQEAAFKLVEMAPEVANAFRKDPFWRGHGLPQNLGFERAIVELSKAEDFAAAIALCQAAHAAGWSPPTGQKWGDRLNYLRRRAERVAQRNPR